MIGKYNGVTMKLRYLDPPLPHVTSLSKEAQRRLEWMDFYLWSGNARFTCRHFGISPDTFYLWKKRFNPKNLSTLEDDKSSRRPFKFRQSNIPKETIDAIVAIRREDPEKSKYEIYHELKSMDIHLGTTSIQKIINRYSALSNAQHIKKVRTRKKRSIARIKAAKELKDKHPGSLVQIDTKHFYVLDQKFYLLCAIDCKTRLGYVFAFKSATSFNASVFLSEVVNAFPFDIKAIQTDNGSEFLKDFHDECLKRGITHYFIDPNCPKQNGRVERFIQTVTYEFFNWQFDLLDDLNMINERCAIFNVKYNTKRLHQSLGYKTPQMYLEGIFDSNLVKSDVSGI